MMNRLWFCLLFFLLYATPSRPQRAKADTLPAADPEPDTCVFCYAGDLWIVGREGGEAKRLTSGPAEDRDPVFSPDGIPGRSFRASPGSVPVSMSYLPPGVNRAVLPIFG